MRFRLLFQIGCLYISAVSPLFAFEFTPEKALSSLKNHCADCHTGEKSKGQFDLTKLSADVKDPISIGRWERILMRVEAGEMPPPDEARPPAQEINAVLNWAKSNLAAELQSRRANQGRSRMRRLNRLEYENTIHDLLGIKTPLRDLLPQDTTADGFDTASSALSISPYHIQQYMDVSELALKAELQHSAKPETRTTRLIYDPVKEKEFMEFRGNKPMIRPRNGETIFFAEPHVAVPAILTQLAELTKAQPGRYRVRVSCYTHDGKDTALTFAIKTVLRTATLGFFEAPADKPGVVEVVTEFEASETIIIAPYHLNEARGDRGLSQFPAKPWVEPSGIGLAIQWIDVEGPLNEVWPPAEHRLLFGDVEMKPFNSLPKDSVLLGDLEKLRGSDKWTPVPRNAPDDARKLLARFLARAFRRPIADDDIQPYLDIATKRLEKKECFEGAMLAAYQAALCSPDFLFLVESPGTLSDHALASRLSYFLWRSMPDEALRATADRGELRKPEVLRRETERLLASPRAQAFVNDFLDHWLRLRNIDATMPDQNLFPECFENADFGTLDPLLRYSILSETRMFFADLLTNDGSVMQCVDSDFTYLNSRLSAHYGLPAVKGSALRRVALPPDSLRGGVITQASVLKVTANGLQTSPVLRGAWLLDTILGRQPPPPPANIGAIEPDTRGTTNIREQLTKHQNNASCAACHSQIDPPGFALECFDPAGQLRSFYRTTETGVYLDNTKFRDGARKIQVKYLKGANVDPTGKTSNGGKFSGPKEFKKIVLQQPHFVARNLAGKLLTYSTGKRTEPGDLLALDTIVQQIKDKNYGLRSLIHEVVQSELFLKK